MRVTFISQKTVICVWIRNSHKLNYFWNILKQNIIKQTQEVYGVAVRTVTAYWEKETLRLYVESKHVSFCHSTPNL
jgi:hypothetical protein